MDASVKWEVSADVDSLIDKINECKKQLVTIVKSRHPYKRNLKTVQCDVYASPKVIELFQCSDTWKDASETPEQEEEHYPYFRQKTSQMIANFEVFKLRRDSVIDDNNVRLIMAFDVGEDCVENYYGNVELKL